MFTKPLSGRMMMMLRRRPASSRVQHTSVEHNIVPDARGKTMHQSAAPLEAEGRNSEELLRRNPKSQDPAVIIPAVACVLLGTGGWIVYALALRGQLGEDSMVFHTAARAWIDGLGSRLYDGYWITQQINHDFAYWLSKPIPLHPWVYPPSFLLLVLPFGYLPFGAAFILLQLFSFVGFAVAACSLLDARRAMLVALVLSPATAANVLLGQNGFMTAALLIGGVALLRRSPLLAGLLLGLLSFKPQFFLMVPVFLLAGRYWRSAAITAGTAIGLALASVALFGVGPWKDWVGLLTSGSGLFHAWMQEARLKDMSVYACVALFGGSAGVANLVQGIAILLGAAAVFHAFRQEMREELRLCVLLVATFLAAPHVANYDAVLLSVAAILLATVNAQERRSAGLYLLAGLIWLCPLFNPPSAFRIGLLTPLLQLVFLGTAVWRPREEGRLDPIANPLTR